MNFRNRIKELIINNKKRFFIIMAVEVFLIILAIIGLFGKNDVYTYDASNASMISGIAQKTENEIILNGSSGEDAEVCFANLEIPRGSYIVELNYQSELDSVHYCNVIDETIGYKMLRASGTLLYDGLDKTNYQIWLLQDTSGLTVTTYYGQGELAISGLVIRETNVLNRIYLFCAVVFSVLFNTMYLFILYYKKNYISKENKIVILGLGLIVLFSSITILTDRVYSGGDLGYHLMRIEGINDGILNGQFPVRIAPEWVQGYGYASSIFYGETLMYIGALFRMIGFTVTTSYHMYMFLINLATVLVSFYCFYKIFNGKYVALLSTMLYTLSIYRAFKTFAACALGEAHAMIFIPLILYGFFKVYTEDIESENYSRSYIPLMIGFTGIIQSHMLTGELVGGFTIILCIILWKRTFRKKTFLVLVKTVVGFVLLSFWFIVPFADYMLTGNFVIHNVWAREIQNAGGYIAHHLISFTGPGAKTIYSIEGMFESNPTNIGIALLVVLFIWIMMLFFRKTECFSKAELALGKITLLFAMISLVLGLSIFPWDKIQSINHSFAVLVSSLQFPHRFFTIASICLAAIAGLITKYVMNRWKEYGLQLWALFLISLTLISGVYLYNEIVYTNIAHRIDNHEGMGSGYISGEEYLPYGCEAEQLLYHDPIGTENVLIDDYEKDGLKISFACENTSDSVGEIELQLLYYKGYKAVDKNTKEELDVFLGGNSVVTVKVPPLYKGEVYVSFVSPWYWRLAELTSFVTFVVFVVVYILRRKRSEKR